jgi:hypothetical protein
LAFLGAVFGGFGGFWTPILGFWGFFGFYGDFGILGVFTGLFLPKKSSFLVKFGQNPN